MNSLESLLQDSRGEFPNPKPRPDEIDAFAKRIVSTSGGCLELRAIGNKSARTWEGKQNLVGFYDDVTAFVRDCLEHHGKKALYVGLNPRNSALLHAQAANQLSPGEGGKEGDVPARHRFTVDIDTKRPSSRIAATDDEIRNAKSVFDAVSADLAAKGIQAEYGFSGNGFHINVETIAYANDSTMNGKNGPFALLLRYFDRKFSSDAAKVDTTTYDIGRVWKIYGTCSIKGANTKERPWRTARNSFQNDTAHYDMLKLYQAEIVEQFQFEKKPETPKKKLAGKAKDTQGECGTAWWTRYAGNLSTLDIVALATEGGYYMKPIRDNMHAIRCPWSSEHADSHDGNGSTVIFESQEEGWPGFHCKHDHCSLRGIAEFLSNFSPDVVDRHCSKSFKSGQSAALASGTTSAERDLPAIIITGSQQREVVAQAWAAIHERNRKKLELFRRGDVVVQPALSGVGGGMLADICQDKMFGIVIRSANVFKVNAQGELQPKDLPAYVPRDMVKIPDKTLPSLNTITGSPFFDKTGTLIVSPGYHPDSETYLHYPTEFPAFQEVTALSASDARQRIEWLRQELFSDFPFVSLADQTNLLAAIFQPFIRKMFDGPTPLILISASSAGSGKSLIAQIISLIVCGEPVPVQVLSGSEEERKKMLLAELIMGRPIVLLDNLDDEMGNDRSSIGGDKLHSPSLAAVLTSTEYTDRLLGQSKKVTVTNQAQWMLTGNNPQLSMEITRRCVPVRLEPDREKPWEERERPFRHPDILAWVRQNRVKLIEAILVAIQSWIAAGRPPVSGKGLGSYEGWSSTMRSLLGFLGFADFLGNMDQLMHSRDPVRDIWSELVARWLQAFGSCPATAEMILNLDTDGLLLPILGQRFPQPSSRKIALGRQLSKQVGRVYHGHKIAIPKASTKHGNQYALVPVKQSTGGSGGSQGNFFQAEDGSQGSQAETGIGGKCSMSGESE